MDPEKKRLLAAVFAVTGLALCLGFYLAFFAGDGTGTVSGKVTLDGEPVEGAQVVFLGEKDGKPGPFVARSTAGGQYKLHGSKGPGVPVGPYKVAVSKLVPKNGTAQPPEGKERPQTGSESQMENLLPERYADVETTPLVLEVKGGRNTLDVELKR